MDTRCDQWHADLFGLWRHQFRSVLCSGCLDTQQEDGSETLRFPEKSKSLFMIIEVVMANKLCYTFRRLRTVSMSKLFVSDAITLTQSTTILNNPHKILIKQSYKVFNLCLLSTKLTFVNVLIKKTFFGVSYRYLFIHPYLLLRH